MGIFIRTVVITAILLGLYYLYISLNEASYKDNLMPVQNVEQPLTPKKQDEPGKRPVNAPAENITVKICLLNSSGEPKFVNRTAKDEGIKTAIAMLLRGATETEKTQGLYSEIPNNVKLYWVKEQDGKLIINLSESFAKDGGTTSIMARIKQLVKTVKIYNADVPVYLYLDGKKAEYIGGDGVYLKQPLN